MREKQVVVPYDIRHMYPDMRHLQNIQIGEDDMIPDEKTIHRPWWDTRIDPPTNRRDSFNAVVKQDKRKNKRNYLKGKK